MGQRMRRNTDGCAAPFKGMGRADPKGSRHAHTTPRSDHAEGNGHDKSKGKSCCQHIETHCQFHETSPKPGEPCRVRRPATPVSRTHKSNLTHRPWSKVRSTFGASPRQFCAKCGAAGLNYSVYTAHAKGLAKAQHAVAQNVTAT